MAEHPSGVPEAGDRFIRLDEGDVHVVQNGRPGAPAVLLIQNAAAPVALWDPLVPLLAGDCHVIRADLLGRRRPGSAGYDVPAQARRAAAVLDRLGVTLSCPK